MIDPLDTMTAADDRADARHTMLVISGFMLVVFGLGSAAQIGLVLHARVDSTPQMLALSPMAETALRSVINLVHIAVALALVWVLAPEQRGAAGRAISLAAIGVVACTVRVLLQLAFTVYSFEAPERYWGDFGVGVAATVLSLGIGLVQTDARTRLKFRERALAHQALRAAAALSDLHDTELRIRRDVAEGLHGTLQNGLIVLETRLNRVADDLPEPMLTELTAVRDELRRMRRDDVREMSDLLYPVALELGAVAAIRGLLDRLPSSIATSFRVSSEAAELEGSSQGVLSAERRLLLVRVVEEGISNALKHGLATGIAVQLTVSDDDALEVSIDDTGVGLPADVTLRGLTRYSEHLRVIGGELTLTPGVEVGVCLSARVPLDRERL